MDGNFELLTELGDIYGRASRGQSLSKRELWTLLEAGEDAVDFADLLPMTLPLDGKPMDVLTRRPMFAPLFRRTRRSARMVFMCGRQIGKSVSLAGAMLMNMIYRERFRVGYVAPQAIFCSRLSHGYLGSMIKGSYLPWPIFDGSCVNNVFEKTFVGGSHYHAIPMFANSNNAIGLTLDWLMFDETQSLNFDLIPYVKETIGTSEFGWETYMGTARGLENTLTQLFDASSANRWNMRCRHCGRTNVPVGQNALKMVQRAGIGCAFCSTDARPRLLDVTDGYWVPDYPDRVTTFDGYQVPQIIVADRIRPDKYFSRIYSKLHGLEAYSTARFEQEVLGIPSESGGRPATPEQVHEASVLDVRDAVPVPTHEYSYIAGGADWGGDGASETSFTVGTLVGFHMETGVFHCLGAIRPRGTAPEHLPAELAYYFRSRVGDALSIIGADGLFVGIVQNPKLGALAHVQCASLLYGSLKTLYKPGNGTFFSLDRSTILFCVYQLIISKRLLFPKGEEFQRFTRDLMATVAEDVVNNSTGVTARRYARIPTKADDFLHALAYALFAAQAISGNQLDLCRMVGLGDNVSVNRSSAADIGEEARWPGYGT